MERNFIVSNCCLEKTITISYVKNDIQSCTSLLEVLIWKISQWFLNSRGYFYIKTIMHNYCSKLECILGKVYCKSVCQINNRNSMFICVL